MVTPRSTRRPGELLGDHPGRRRFLPGPARNRRRQPLTDADRAEIHKTLKQVLHTAQHPTITFRSRRVDGSAGSFTLDGELTIMGITRPVTVQGAVTDGRVVGGASVVQSRWGIRPHSAFLGALKLSDEVKVDFDMALPPDS
jgi:YceI-like domain